MTLSREPMTSDTRPAPVNYLTGDQPASPGWRGSLRTAADPASQGSMLVDACRVHPGACGWVEAEGLPRISLVSNGDALMAALNQALEPCPLEIRLFRSCHEAWIELGRSTTAEVIFTDVQLPDGDWRRLLGLARENESRAEVIIVSRFVDVPLYLDALEAGAFDFVVPPFRTEELGYVIVNAMYGCCKQRSRKISGKFLDPLAA